MSMPRRRTLATLVASTAAALGLAACAHGPSRPGADRPAPIAGDPRVIRFDNDAREHVHVYLIGEQREWMLGRVEPGARATLRLPAAALSTNPGFMRLAVLTGERATVRAARAPGALYTIAQPAAALLGQRWMFVQGQVMSLQPRPVRP